MIFFSAGQEFASKNEPLTFSEPIHQQIKTREHFGSIPVLSKKHKQSYDGRVLNGLSIEHPFMNRDIRNNREQERNRITFSNDALDLWVIKKDTIQKP